ncbi:MAG TPA: hypothetical protein VEK34_02595 [Methylocella sp.]|nr:hypothetical protein [Methylocella sp.]
MVDDAAKRIAGYAVAATVTVAVAAIVFVEPYLLNMELQSKIGVWLITLLGSAATYRTISASLWSLFNRSLCVRRIALGRMFLEGTWIGHYVRSGQHIVTVEFYDQKDGELRITGAEINSTSATLSHWQSFAASIDYRGETVTYAYACDIFGRSGTHDGIARFTLVRKGKKSAFELDGYSADLTDGVKDANYEYKISDRQIDRSDALLRAKEIYKF